jgi:UDP-glucose 4-epimerase
MAFDYSLLVTGASGFLGSVVTARLRDLGARVVGTTHGVSSDNDLVPVDLEDYACLSKLNRRGPFDAVLHLAAVLPGRRGELETLMANERMTYNFAKWSVEQKTAKFLYASSCSVYGLATGPCDEATVPQPHNPYAVSKLACEHLLNIIAGQSNTELCVLRISAPYGPNMIADTVVTRFLRRMSEGLPLELMGSGSRRQDFVYQDDVSEACALALQHRAVGVFNVSGDKSISMRELAETVLRMFGKPVSENIVFVGEDPQEPYRGGFPIRAATESFHYKPKVNLEEGLRKTAKALKLL